ncbi:MAG TPA: lysophospholipid acyltransferase family protein [Candidatus Binatia bacterium]|nr:lysophospholipid acyltransferase family protein [Candidatus Binatia bacterium]
MRNMERTPSGPPRGSVFTRLRSWCVFVPIVYLYTGVLGTLALLASPFDGSGRVQHWCARIWATIILKTVGIRARVEGLQHLHTSPAAIYAANHLSAIDIPLLYAHLPGQFRIMAKRALFRYPFLGWYLKRSGQIPIVVGDPHASLRSLNRAGDALRRGMPLVVFPEGGRSRTGELQEFMGGAFYAAIRAQAPVVPMAIVGTYEMLPMNSFHVIPGEAVLTIGEPIPTAGLRVRDTGRLARQVRQAIAELYDSRARSVPQLNARSQGEPKPMLNI